MKRIILIAGLALLAGPALAQVSTAPAAGTAQSGNNTGGEATGTLGSRDGTAAGTVTANSAASSNAGQPSRTGGNSSGGGSGGSSSAGGGGK